MKIAGISLLLIGILLAVIRVSISSSNNLADLERTAKTTNVCSIAIVILLIIAGLGLITDSKNSQDLNILATTSHQDLVKKISGSSLILENLEITKNNLPGLYSWEEAHSACTALGDDWRIPTKDELLQLYQNRGKIQGFAINAAYWSASENDENSAWAQNFSIGTQNYFDKAIKFNVRLVRTV